MGEARAAFKANEPGPGSREWGDGSRYAIRGPESKRPRGVALGTIAVRGGEGWRDASVCVCVCVCVCGTKDEALSRRNNSGKLIISSSLKILKTV